MWKIRAAKIAQNFSNPGTVRNRAPYVYEASRGSFYPFFFSSLLPLSVYLRPLVSSAGSTGLFIFAASKRVTDDGTMLIIPPMWEPIVTRSYRGSMTKTRIVRFWRSCDYIRRIDLEKNQREPTLLVEDIYIRVRIGRRKGTLNGGTESS